MKQAATALAIALAAAAAAIAGCGSEGGETTSAPQPLKRAGDAGGPPGASVRVCAVSSEMGLERVRVTGVSCRQASIVLVGWRKHPQGCAPRRGASRSSCPVQGYRCLSVRTARGLAVNCARRGRSISFIRRS
jgi:hypothetical protein